MRRRNIVLSTTKPGYRNNEAASLFSSSSFNKASRYVYLPAKDRRKEDKHANEGRYVPKTELRHSQHRERNYLSIFVLLLGAGLD